MDFPTFVSSLKETQPSSNLSPLLKALWYDAKGDWNAAHDIADGFGTEDGDWVHAYLHRKDGDEWNANYWYQRAGRNTPKISLEEEWEEMVKALL